MADLTETIRLLERQRDELLDQVNAIIRALAALKGTDGSTRRAVPAHAALPEERSTARRRANGRPKRHFVLTEEHKQKLLEGQRRAREARQTAAAGDTPAPFDVAHDAPRLVRREPTIES